MIWLRIEDESEECGPGARISTHIYLYPANGSLRNKQRAGTWLAQLVECLLPWAQVVIPRVLELSPVFGLPAQLGGLLLLPLTSAHARSYSLK